MFIYTSNMVDQIYEQIDGDMSDTSYFTWNESMNVLFIC